MGMQLCKLLPLILMAWRSKVEMEFMLVLLVAIGELLVDGLVMADEMVVRKTILVTGTMVMRRATEAACTMMMEAAMVEDVVEDVAIGGVERMEVDMAEEPRLTEGLVVPMKIERLKGLMEVVIGVLEVI
jgi:hypothetical protein